VLDVVQLVHTVVWYQSVL